MKLPSYSELAAMVVTFHTLFERIKEQNKSMAVQIQELMELEAKSAQWNAQREIMLAQAVELLKQNPTREIKEWLSNNGFN